jgi:multidrug resistance efflux pump
MRFGFTSRNRLIYLGVATVLVYCAWLGGPYLRSIVTRDAAVTTWITETSSPIAGLVDPNPLYPGQRVGADGIILKVSNPRADRTPLVRAEAELDRATARVTALAHLAAATTQIISERAAVAARYAQLYKQDVDADLAGAGSILLLTQQRVGLERNQAGRLASLSRTGNASQSAADAATGGLTEQARTLTTIETSIARAKLHREAADAGIFMLDDRTDGGDAQRSLSDARLELARIEADLAIAEADEAAARQVADAARQDYDRRANAGVQAPPGALVWSLLTGPGAAVEPGMPVATWLDCKLLLVDVPASDVEIALLETGSPAEIVLEGERRARHGKVILLRGSAATIGPHDLAAIAKGRHRGIGQALVQLEPSAADSEACPIGHAAYVDFPGLGLIDVVIARLRL